MGIGIKYNVDRKFPHHLIPFHSNKQNPKTSHSDFNITFTYVLMVSTLGATVKAI